MAEYKECRLIDILIYDVTGGYSKLFRDTAIIEDTDEGFERLIIQYIRKFGASNVFVENFTVTVLKVRS